MNTDMHHIMTFLMKDRLHRQWWLHKIIMELKISCHLDTEAQCTYMFVVVLL